MYRVLIVDDERSIRNGLKNIVPWEECGFSQVLTAANGEEALEILGETPCDLMITDLKMPVMDGVTLIMQAHNLGYDLMSVILSGYQDFESAKKALRYNVKDYLLKPVDRNELTQCVVNIKKLLDEKVKTSAPENFSAYHRNELFHNMMRGKVDYDLKKDELAGYNITKFGTKYCAAILRISGASKIDAMEMNEIMEYNKKIREAINLSLGDEVSCQTYDKSKNVFGLLLYGELDKESVEAVLNKIYLNIYKVINVTTFITYGKIVDKFDDINVSWNQARKISDSSKTTGAKVLAYNEELDIDRPEQAIKWDNKILIKAIEEDDVSTINREIELLCAEINENLTTNRNIRSVLYNLMVEISKLLREYGGDIEELPEFKRHRDYVEGGDFRNLNYWLLNMCDDTTDYISKLLTNRMGGVIYKVQQYIHENYMTEMTLQTIAVKFYVNPSYLGRLFKKTLNVSFNEYLNKYRITKVKQKMQNYQGKVSDLIDVSGYSNPEYFYRQFKKYEGISFMQYREELKQKNEKIQ